MSLHVEVTGHGEPLVMLHGWGMHSGIWSDTAAQLAQNFEVHCVDLPGHGYSKGKGEGGRGKGEEGRGNSGAEVFHLPLSSSPFSLDILVDQLSAQFKNSVTLCGWSLGGQIALHWAVREPEKINRLVLVTSTPCFAEREDWIFGMPQEVLEQFSAELEKNHAATLRRFLALQVRGSVGERELLAELRERLFSRGEPNPEALRGGLEILRDADLRGVLPEIKQPALVMAGERDRLTPPEASYYLAHAMPNARVVEIEGAAHAPFLSHQERFVDEVRGFLKAKIK